LREGFYAIVIKLRFTRAQNRSRSTFASEGDGLRKIDPQIAQMTLKIREIRIICGFIK
jgi:hypothetical protein